MPDQTERHGRAPCGEKHGWLVVFSEVDGVWLIDEIGQIVPELGGRG